MVRQFLLAAGFLCASVAVAADKYAVPPHPASDVVKKCAITFDKNQPVTTGNDAGWSISASGKYNYDTMSKFRSIDVKLVYINSKTQAVRSGPSYSITDETTLATAGSWSASFTNVAPPKADESIRIYATISVTTQGLLPTNNSVNSAVPPPGVP